MRIDRAETQSEKLKGQVCAWRNIESNATMVMRQRRKEHKQACSRPALRAPLVSRAGSTSREKNGKETLLLA